MPINLDRLRTGGAYAGALSQPALDAVALPRELQPGARVGPFRVEHELARGGMGVVYLAQRDDGEFSQRVALKWMAGDGARDVAESLFRRERDILAGLEHPGIARLIDGGRSEDGMLWFAMEYVAGAAIDEWCIERRLPLGERVARVIELCDAVAFAHQRLLIHRDIKPGNVLVGEDGRVKLLDFGIARLADQRDLVGTAPLTPGYASPEQWAGGEVTSASDIYQIGLVLASVCGVLARPGQDRHATCAAFSAADVSLQPQPLDAARLRLLPRELAAIILLATRVAPAERYPTVLDLRQDLAAFLDRRPVRARGGGAGYRLFCLLRRHPWSSSAAALGLASILLLGWRVVLERDTALAEAARARASLDFVAELLKWAKPSENHGQPVSVDQALARGVAQLAERRDLQPRLQGELAHVLGAVYLQRRERDEARPLLEQAYRQLREAGVDDVSILARTALELGSVLGGAEDRARSLALLDEAMQWSRGRPSLHDTYVGAWRIRVLRRWQSGEALVALEDVERLIDHARRDPRTEADTRAELLATRASILESLGRDNERLEVLRQLRDDSLHRHGARHPTTSQATLSLVNALVRAGAYDEAGTLLNGERAISRELWTESHAEFSRLLITSAFLAYRRGDRSTARAEAEQAIAIAAADGGRGRQFLSGHLELLGLIESERGDAAAAERALRASLEASIAGAALAPDQGRRRLALAGVLLDLGRDEEARRELDAVRPLLDALAPTHVRHLKALQLERRLLQRAGAHQEAERRLDAALDRLAALPADEARDARLAELRALRDDAGQATRTSARAQ